MFVFFSVLDVIVPSLVKGEEGAEKTKKPYYGKKKLQKKLSQRM